MALTVSRVNIQQGLNMQSVEGSQTINLLSKYTVSIAKLWFIMRAESVRYCRFDINGTVVLVLLMMCGLFVVVKLADVPPQSPLTGPTVLDFTLLSPSPPALRLLGCHHIDQAPTSETSSTPNHRRTNTLRLQSQKRQPYHHKF